MRMIPMRPPQEPLGADVEVGEVVTTGMTGVELESETLVTELVSTDGDEEAVSI